MYTGINQLINRSVNSLSLTSVCVCVCVCLRYIVLLLVSTVLRALQSTGVCQTNLLLSLAQLPSTTNRMSQLSCCSHESIVHNALGTHTHTHTLINQSINVHLNQSIDLCCTLESIDQSINQSVRSLSLCSLTCVCVCVRVIPA